LSKYGGATYSKTFFEFGDKDYIKLMRTIHKVFVCQINRYFRDKYKITIDEKVDRDIFPICLYPHATSRRFR
jgi:hypothetical protein